MLTPQLQKAGVDQMSSLHEDPSLQFLDRPHSGLHIAASHPVLTRFNKNVQFWQKSRVSMLQPDTWMSILQLSKLQISLNNFGKQMIWIWNDLIFWNKKRTAGNKSHDHQISCCKLSIRAAHHLLHAFLEEDYSLHIIHFSSKCHCLCTFLGCHLQLIILKPSISPHKIFLEISHCW